MYRCATPYSRRKYEKTICPKVTLIVGAKHMQYQPPSMGACKNRLITSRIIHITMTSAVNPSLPPFKCHRNNCSKSESEL